MIIPNIWENKKWQPNHQPDNWWSWDPMPFHESILAFIPSPKPQRPLHGRRHGPPPPIIKTPPTTVSPEMALVTDIRGLWRAGTTYSKDERRGEHVRFINWDVNTKDGNRYIGWMLMVDVWYNCNVGIIANIAYIYILNSCNVYIKVYLDGFIHQI